MDTDSKKEAEEQSRKLYDQLKAQAENPTRKEKVSLDTILGRYWIEEGQYRASGEDTIYSRLQRFKDFFGKITPWQQINDDKIRKYVSDRRTHFVPRTKRLISPATINKELNLLGRINNLAIDIWDVEPAPFKIKKHRLEEEETEKSYFAPEVQEKIIEHLPDYWARAVRFLLYTGVRAQHVFLRKNQNWDRLIRKRDVYLADNINDCFIRIRAKSKKPGGKIMEIVIIDECYNLLVKELEIENLKPDDILFVYPKNHKFAGRPLGDYRDVLYDAMEAAAFDRKLGEGMHLTRHTFGTRMAQSGTDEVITQKALGHVNIRTTRIYTHRKRNQLREAMQKSNLAEKRQSEEKEEN